MRVWKPKKTMVKEDQKEYWSTRPVTCGGCGESSPHFLAVYDPELELLTVPYAGLNGGIGREIGAEHMDDVLGDKEREFFLSSCCDFPRFRQLSRKEQRAKARRLWLPKFPELEEQCVSCPFLKDNDAEFAEVLQRLSDHAGKGPVGEATVLSARLKIRNDLHYSGDFVCHQTVYRKGYGDLAPESQWKQCKGATKFWRSGERP